MSRPYTPYIPREIGEVVDKLGSMMLSSPTFVDETGWFPDKNINTEFYALNEGLKNIRDKIGQERYEALIELSHKMRALFEADPDDTGDETVAGREIIMQMQEMLRRKRRKF